MNTGKEFYPQYETHFDATRDRSFYDEPDPLLLEFFKELPHNGSVLELAAGDGRYTMPLLAQGLSVVATDLETRPLAALEQKSQRRQFKRLTTRGNFNAFETFPLKEGTFDGVVCTGFLYLFPPEYIEHVIAEVGRVTGEKGIFIADFVTDRTRTDSTGKVIQGEKEMTYSLENGRQMMHGLLATQNFASRILVNTLDVTMEGGIRVQGNKLNIFAQKPRGKKL